MYHSYSYSSSSSYHFHPALIFLIAFFLIITLVAYWRVFVKAGEPGWKAIIPIYNIIITFKIAGRNVYWALLLVIPIVNLFVAAYMYIGLGRSFGKDTFWSLILLWLLGPIGILILAFDKSKYLGPGGSTTLIPQQPVAQ